MKVPNVCCSGEADGVFLRPGLKGSGLLSCYLLDGIFHHRRTAVTNRLEGLGDSLRHRSRKPGAKETLDGGLYRHIDALNRLAESLRQNAYLLGHAEQF